LGGARLPSCIGIESGSSLWGFDPDADADPDTDACGEGLPGGWLVRRGRVLLRCCGGPRNPRPWKWDARGTSRSCWDFPSSRSSRLRVRFHSTVETAHAKARRREGGKGQGSDAFLFWRLCVLSEAGVRNPFEWRVAVRCVKKRGICRPAGAGC
jgi:hypothetical protein